MLPGLWPIAGAGGAVRHPDWVEIRQPGWLLARDADDGVRLAADGSLSSRAGLGGVPAHRRHPHLLRNLRMDRLAQLGVGQVQSHRELLETQPDWVVELQAGLHLAAPVE